MACDSKKGLSKAMNSGSSDKPKPQKIRPWLTRWSNELSDNGEMVKAWCLRLSKEPGMVRCKYCKIKVNYTNKGLSALRCHSNTRKHMDNGKLYHLRVSKGSAGGQKGPAANRHSKPQKKRPISSQKTPAHKKKSSTSTTTKVKAAKAAAIGGGQSKVKLKVKGRLTAYDVIKAKLNRQHHLQHTIIPSNPSSKPQVSAALSSKLSVPVPVLSKKFLQFKTKPSKTPSPLSHNKLSAFSSTTPRPKSHFTFPSQTHSHSSLPTSLNNSRNQPSLVHPKLHSQLSQGVGGAQNGSLSQFQSLSRLSAANFHRSSPIPGQSPYLGHPHKSFADPNQVFNGANLRATRPPHLGHTVQRRPIQLVPVFMCYFCHGEFPSKSCLYEHQEQCTLKLEAEAAGSKNSINNNNNNNNNNDRATDMITSLTATTTTATSTTKLTMENATISVSARSSRIECSDATKSSDNQPTTPNNPEQIPNAFFFPNLRTPQKPPSSLSSSLLSVSSSSYNNNNNVSKPSFLNGLNLLPIKTALKEQKRISRKRRNTECESLDWAEDDTPLTPKTPCTPPTPKLLISHLSREEYRRELPPHRLFRLSSTTSTSSSVPTRKSESDTKDSDKDLMDLTSVAGGEASQSHNASDEGNNEKEGVLDGKISIFRSLYNVDVTSPLGQFVIRHYKADPSLHILSDLESHCLTSPSATKKTTNFSLRARNVAYPITFGVSGRRLLYHDYYHLYKFNKTQVREFMKTANTGLNKDSRRLLRQMKKCQVTLRRISKSDLRYWISSRNNITVDLKLLSMSEIEQWTSPKSTSSQSISSSPSTSSEESDWESVFPEGLKSSSPAVKNVLGLKTKREVRIKTVNMLSPSVLNITHYVSEETCADLISNRKTVYRSLLSDWSKSDSENVDVSINDITTDTVSQPPRKDNNTILRRMLSNRPVLGSCLTGNTLPDITNLTAAKSTVSTVVAANVIPKPNQVHSNSSATKSKTTIEANSKSKLLLDKRKTTSRGRKTLVEEIGNNNTSCTVNMIVSNKSDNVKDEICDLDEVDSCAEFTNLPNPCDLLREKTPSQYSNKSRQSSPGEASSSTPTPSTSSNSSIRRRQSDRLRHGPKWSGPYSIAFAPPTTGSKEIVSIENNPGLMKDFLEHFKCLREEKLDSDYSGRRGDFVCISTKRRQSPSPKKSDSHAAKRMKYNVGENDDSRRLDLLKSFLEGGRISKGGGSDIKHELKDEIINDEENKADKDVTTITTKVENINDATRDWAPIKHRMSRSAERFSRNAARGSNTSPHLRSSTTPTTPRRRKSSPRVTTRVKKVGLNRRLSAAGLVKREESLGSPRSPRTPNSTSLSRSRSPILAMGMGRINFNSDTNTNTNSTATTPTPILTPSASDSGGTTPSSAGIMLSGGGGGGAGSDNSKSASARIKGSSSSSDNGNGKGFGGRKTDGGSPSPSPSPVRIRIRRDKLPGQRNSDKFQKACHTRRNIRHSRDKVGDSGESPIPIPKLRIRNGSKLVESRNRNDSPECSVMGGDDSCCDVKVSVDTQRSRSASALDTRSGGGLQRRKCVVSSSSSISSSSSSLSSSVLQNGNDVGVIRVKSASMTNVPKSSFVCNNAGMGGRRSSSVVITNGNADATTITTATTGGGRRSRETASTANLTQQQQSSVPNSNRGGLMQFVSSFKLI